MSDELEKVRDQVIGEVAEAFGYRYQTLTPDQLERLREILRFVVSPRHHPRVARVAEVMRESAMASSSGPLHAATNRLTGDDWLSLALAAIFGLSTLGAEA